MEIITKELKIPYFDDYIFDEYFSGMRYACFDIETLGLDPRKAPLVLCGLMEVESDGTAHVKQYFLDEPEEEHVLIEELIQELNSYDLLITFNGKRFDLPYVARRFQMIHHEEPVIRPYDLDLYQVVKYSSSLGEFLPSLRQKSIEEYMGLSHSRTDEISGAESVELYYRYITEADKEVRENLKETILLHNFDDVVQLYKLLPVLRQCDLHAALLRLGFPVKLSDGSSRIIKTVSSKFLRKELTVSGEYTGDPVSYIGYSTMDTPLRIELKSDHTFTLTLPVEKDRDSVYVNLLDFFSDTKEFWGMSGYVNDYLILKDGKDLNARDINFFIRRVIDNLTINIIVT